MRRHIKINGDTSVGGKYVPLGKSTLEKIGRLQKYGEQNFSFDDATMQVRVSGEDGYIYIDVIGGTKLESGALVLGSHSTAYPDSIIGCDVYRAGVTDILKTDSVFSVTGEVKMPSGDPYHSKVYSLKNPPTKLPVNPPPDPSNFLDAYGEPDPVTYKMAKYPDQNDLLLRKRVLQFLDASKATGKTRLFLQAICGSIPHRITLDTGISVPTRYTVARLDNTLVLSWTNYIIRDNHCEYWMMDKTRAYHMQFDAVGIRVKAKLKALLAVSNISRNDEIKIEAVLFSHIKVGVDNDGNLTGFKPCVWPAATGAALQYDWHFAYQASTGVRCGLTGPPTPNPHPTLIRQGHIEEMSFASGVTAGDPPIPSIWTIETGLFSYLTGITFEWRIDPYTNTQFVDVPFTAGEPGNYDGPVYSFYDSADSIITVRYSKTAPTASGSTVVTDSRNPCGYGNYETKTISAGSETGGFYVTSAGWDGRGTSENTPTSFEELKENAGYQGETVYPVAPGGSMTQLSDCTGRPTRTAFAVGGSVTSGIEITTRILTDKNIAYGTTYTFNFILFPLDNPDAIYVGKQDYADKPYFENITTYAETTLQEVNSQLGPTFYTWSMGLLNGGSVTTSNPQSVREFTWDESAKLITQHSAFTPHTYHRQVTVRDNVYTRVDPVSDWNTVFEPDPEYAGPYYNRAYKVRESMTGMLWYSKDTQHMDTSPGVIPNNQEIYFIGYA